ncbi:MAG: permease-like cell division protein FtsX [Pseudomonadota bacterium]
MSRGASQGAFNRALRQMREDPWLQGVAISTLTVALAIVGAYLALCLNIQQAGSRLVTGATLMVALDDALSLEQARALSRELAANPQVDQVRLVNKDEALTRFRRQLGPHQGLLEGLEDNPLPNALEVFLVPGGRAAPGLVEELTHKAGVIQVVSSRPWLHRLEKSASTLAAVAVALGFLLFLGVVLLVTNTVRLAVYVRREHLEILDLVGATASYVRWPFVLEAMLQALAASGLASLLVWGLLRVLEAPAELPLGLDLSQLMGFPWQVPVALLLLAVLAGGLGGLLGVGRVLRPPAGG